MKHSMELDIDNGSLVSNMINQTNK